jgi:hypothetical protein
MENFHAADNKKEEEKNDIGRTLSEYRTLNWLRHTQGDKHGPHLAAAEYRSSRV